MESQQRRNGSGEPEALQPIEPTAIEQVRQFSNTYLLQVESPLLHYWRILKKRRWTVAATLVIIFALSVITTLNTTRLYQATSKVAIFPESQNVLGFKDFGNSPLDYQYDVILETQAAILRSDALAMKVIEAMHLDENPTFAGATGAHAENSVRVSSMQPDPARAAGLLGAF